MWDAADDRERHVLSACAVRRAARAQVAFSHATSVVLHGGPDWGVDLGEVHVARQDARSGRAEAGVRRHRVVVQEEELETTRGLSHTAPARAALEVLSTAGVETALCVANDFLHRGLMTPEDLAASAQQAQHWPGTLAAPVLLSLADRRVETVGESRTAYLFHCHGIRGAVPQHEVRDGGRLLGRVDFAFPDAGVFVEFDGRVKYTTLLRPGETVADVVLREKRRQERIAAATGWECIRITWVDLAAPGPTAERIRTALERGRARRRLRLNSAS
ncbi:hypothetical protein ACOACO_18275 [Nocardioides sp. CPCC 205120]|uniref:hypothetical protein n=1 Tax=Nocardioides sp. CPCC 205120 TaxID=3406462 RepID=UPI003B505EF1